VTNGELGGLLHIHETQELLTTPERTRKSLKDAGDLNFAENETF
jgi:hypothetical protein